MLCVLTSTVLITTALLASGKQRVFLYNTLCMEGSVNKTLGNIDDTRTMLQQNISHLMLIIYQETPL